MLSLFFINDYVRGNHFSKVIHYQMCIDFLLDTHHLLEWKLSMPIVYFKSLNDVSIPQRDAYSFFNSLVDYQQHS